MAGFKSESWPDINRNDGRIMIGIGGRLRRNPQKKGSQKSSMIDPVNDFILWYGKSERSIGKTKYRALFEKREYDSDTIGEFSKIEMPDGTVYSVSDVPGVDGSPNRVMK